MIGGKGQRASCGLSKQQSFPQSLKVTPRSWRSSHDAAEAEGWPSCDALAKLMEEKELELMEGLVGTPTPELPAAALALALQSSVTDGIKGDEKDVASRMHMFGSNTLDEQRPKWYLEFVWEALQDLTIILLLVMSAITLTVEMVWGHDKAKGWLDGVAIFLSVRPLLHMAWGGVVGWRS